MRALAAELLEKGETPSSRKIRELLGGGSLSTITDELRLWEAEMQQAKKPVSANTLPSRGDPPRALGLSPMAEPTSLPSDEPRSGAIPDAAALLERIVGELAITNIELERLREELLAARKSQEHQLSLAYERYEAVQRQSLMQVEAARREASELREKLNNAKMDAQIREDAVKAKSQKLRDENAVLTAKVEVFEELMAGRGAPT